MGVPRTLGLRNPRSALPAQEKHLREAAEDFFSKRQAEEEHERQDWLRLSLESWNMTAERGGGTAGPGILNGILWA